jgi:hypothetical protein
MPPSPLARAARSPRWRRRLALAAVLTGVVAGPVVASPADAHGTGKHFVTISGWVKTEPSNASPCVATYNQTITLQRGKTEAKTIDINKGCDGHTAGLRLTARLRDDKYVDTEGFIRIHARSCFISEPLCGWVNESRNYRSSIFEDTIQDMPHPETLKAETLSAWIDATWDFDIIVDGPDAPAM